MQELRAAGKAQSKWLLVNIQSPTEFASQQLNRDTWRDETLRMYVEASFLFWQQYHDQGAGEVYTRNYLRNYPGARNKPPSPPPAPSPACSSPFRRLPTL